MQRPDWLPPDGRVHQGIIRQANDIVPADRRETVDKRLAGMATISEHNHLFRSRHQRRDLAQQGAGIIRPRIIGRIDEKPERECCRITDQGELKPPTLCLNA